MTYSDVIDLTEFRCGIHKRPKVSGEDREMSRNIVNTIKSFSPSRAMTGLAGHGVASVFKAFRL